MIELTLENVGIIFAIITPIGIAIAFMGDLRNKVNELQRELNRLKIHPLLVYSNLGRTINERLIS